MSFGQRCDSEKNDFCVLWHTTSRPMFGSSLQIGKPRQLQQSYLMCWSQMFGFSIFMVSQHESFISSLISWRAGSQSQMSTKLAGQISLGLPNAKTRKQSFLMMPHHTRHFSTPARFHDMLLSANHDIFCYGTWFKTNWVQWVRTYDVRVKLDRSLH